MKYVFNYPTQTGTLAYTGSLPGGFVARTVVGAMNRIGRSPYALWDASAGYTRGRVRPFAQASNLTSTTYEEIPGVRMPGRSFLAGVEVLLYRR